MPQLPQLPMQSLSVKPPPDISGFVDGTDPSELAMADVVAKYGMDAAHEAAALRTRRAVRPPGGRQEGVVTKVLEGIGEIPGQMVGSFKNMMDAAYSHPPGMSVRDNPQLTGLVAENALNVVGAPAMGGGMPGLGSGVSKGIRAYHGSPHDFDRFDMSKIGTGEGAQAYGHGLYFAENPKVAADYKKRLGPKAAWPSIHKEVDAFLDAAGASGQARDVMRPYVTRDLDLMRARVAGGEDAASVAAEYGYKRPEVAAALQSIVSASKGRMYEVNIRAKPEEFLDWDKPLSEQLHTIKTALGDVGYFGDGRRPSEGYRKLASDFGGPDMASGILRDAGIPGIKYLDQGSRGAGQGTSNYVLFRDDIIDILKKYGIAGLMTALGVAQQGGEAKAETE